jgi:hypothetical protein
LATYQITVVDSYSKLPLGGACITLIAIDPITNSSIFFQGYTNGYGVTTVDTNGYTPDNWRVELAGYKEQLFVGAPSQGVIVYLESIVPEITLNIATSGLGYVANGPTNQYPPIHGPFIFFVGSTITFVAIPEQQSAFLNWVLNGTTYTDNTLNLTITQSMEGQTLTAVFSGEPSPSRSSLLGLGILSIIAVAVIGYLALKK